MGSVGLNGFASVFGYLLLSLTAESRVLFKDEFGEASRGERMRNTVVDPEPEGWGYTTNTPYGYVPKNWILYDPFSDERRRGFWCIPEDYDGNVTAVMRQAGRSGNSTVYARVPVPEGVTRYRVEFRQLVVDNDYIGFIVGAKSPGSPHAGAEFGYERQFPGSDATTNDIYYSGIFGTGVIKGEAHNRFWSQHRIEVEGGHIAWYQDDELLIEGDYQLLGKAFNPSGYFGIRMTWERNTSYDDFRIVAADASWDYSWKFGWMYSFDESGWTYLHSFNTYAWLDHLGPTLTDLGGFWMYLADADGTESGGGQPGTSGSWAYTAPDYWNNHSGLGPVGWLYLESGPGGQAGWYRYIQDNGDIYLSLNGVGTLMQIASGSN